MKKKLLALLCAFGIMLSVSLPVSAATSFKDVPSSHWAYQDIMTFIGFGAINGYPDGTFHPENNISYAEVATVYYNLMGDIDAEYQSFYPDVSSNHWAYKAITNAGIYLPLYPDNHFYPGNNAEREDIAYFLGQYVSFVTEKDTAGTKSNFSDYNQISPDLAPYVDFAVEAGLINGYANGTFAPTAPVTRAEFVVMLNRLNTYLVNADKDITFSSLAVAEAFF